MTICDNCIHRNVCADEGHYDEALSFCADKIEEKPHGMWIIHPHSMIMKCSLCGHEETAADTGVVDPNKHFCSNCGADMRGSESNEKVH